MKEKSKPDWNSLFAQALTLPGVMSQAYSVFYEYSLGNAFLAASQLVVRNLPISPIASYKKWLELGRQVKKGEKAIALVMPVTVKSKSKDEGKEGESSNEACAQPKGSGRTIFILKNNWFALCQTDGAEYAHEAVTPKWDKARALDALGITEQDFSSMSGNAQGYAIPNEKKLAINPLAALPWKTTFHEMAHCLLHSAEAQMADGEMLQRCIKEAEAESVAYLCCATLELPGLEQSRAYIQHWLGSEEQSDLCCATLELPGLEQSRAYIQHWLGSEEQSEEFKKKSAARVFAAANKILKAGAEAAKAGEVGNE